MIELLKILGKTLAVITVALGVYELFFQNNKIMPYTMFSLGSMILVMGVSEIKEERKRIGIFSIFVSIFLFLVTIYISLN